MPPRKRAAHSKKLADAKVAKVAKEENQVTAVRSLLSVFCSAISFTTDNFCHLSCPFSQVVPWSRLRRRTFSLLSPLTCLLSVLCSALFSLCSPLSSPLFSLSPCPDRVPSSIPRVLSNCLLALLSLCPSPLSALPHSLLPVFSLLSPLPAPRVTVFAAHRACQHDRFP